MAPYGLKSGMPNNVDIQRARLVIVPPPEKKIEIKEFKRIGRCGLIYIDRTYSHPDLPPIYEPDCNQTPAVLPSSLKDGLMPLSMQDGPIRPNLSVEPSLFDIFNPSDNEESAENQWLKSFGVGFRNFSKQKKKLSSGNFIEPS